MSTFFFFFFWAVKKIKSKLIVQMGFFGKFTQKSPYFHEGGKKKVRSCHI
jgi:hypothetical protein